MPQLISWLLGGEHSGEETYASTTQMMNPRSRGWAKDFLRKHDLPTNILPELEKPGTKIGQVKEHYAEELESTPEILLPASHDTASAVAGMPLGEGHKAFLSTGIWFIGGVELDKPLLTDGAFEIEASNELGVEGTTRFLKNINGFFLLEECREEWKEKNGIYEYDEILDAAFNAGSLGSLIDPNNDSFVTEGNMTEKITSYCRETGQKVPKGEGEIARCIFESLAIKTALIMDDILKVAGDSPDILHLGGGGVRNELFCQMLSSAIGIPIHAGPIEAAAIGNILVQARARSEIGDIEEGRKLIRGNLKIRKYEPQEPDRWEEGKNRISLL